MQECLFVCLFAVSFLMRFHCDDGDGWFAWVAQSLKTGTALYDGGFLFIYVCFSGSMFLLRGCFCDFLLRGRILH